MSENNDHNPESHDNPAIEIFDRARRLTGDARRSYLEQVCGDDAAVRAEIESMLAVHDEQGDFLANPTVVVPHEAPLTEKPGQMIDRYKLLQQIGEGGFGTVFLAEQRAPVRRRVALKIIKLGMDTRQVIARFEAERQALALMNHPNIARVLDAGATESGRPYFVMEYVMGDPITDFAEAHRLPLSDRLTLFMQVCNAVQHAHTKGIIHRDIKPTNVLVAMTDGRPLAKVIDFGIAKATTGLTDRLTSKTLFTEHKQLIGTPQYMSPEQAEGLPDIDTKTDVYALGVLLYELLTGETPFDAKRLRSAAFAEMQRIIKEEEPPAPSVRLQRKLPTRGSTSRKRSGKAASESAKTRISTSGSSETHSSNPSTTQVHDLKGELDWIVMKALDKDRARRYETANEFAADIDNHLTGDPVIAAPPSAGYRLRKFVRRHRGAVMTGSAIAAALLLGTAGTTWGLLRAQDAITKEQKVNEQLSLHVDIGREAMKEVGRHLFSCDECPPEEAAEIPSIVMNAVTLSQLEPLYPDASEEELEIRAWAEFTGQMARHTATANKQLEAERDLAEWSAYTANLALAQAAMEAGNWSEARERVELCPESKRGWEWEWTRNMANSVIAEFPGVGVVSPDGQLLAVRNGSTIRIYDMDGEPVSEKMEHDGEVLDVEFAQDSSAIISHTGQRVYIWTQDGVLTTGPITVEGGLSHVALSPGEHMMLTKADWPYRGNTEESRIRLWDQQGRPLIDPIVFDPRYHYPHPQFSPNGQFVLIAERYDAYVVNLAGERVGKVMHHGHPGIRSAEFDSLGNVVTITGDTVRYWSKEGEQICDPLTLEGFIHGQVEISSDPKLKVIETTGGAYFWDTRTSHLTYVDHTTSVGGYTYHPHATVALNPSRILTRPTQHQLRYVDLTGAPVGRPMSHWYEPHYVTADEDSGSVATKSHRPVTDFMWDEVRTWDGRGVSQGEVTISPSYFLTNTQFGGRADRLILRCGIGDGIDRFVQIRKLPLLSPVQNIERASTHSHAQPFHIAAQLAGGVAPDNSEAVENFLNSAPEIADFDGEVVVALPDESRVVTGDDEGAMRFWEPESGREIMAIRYPAGVERIRITADLTRIVVELENGSARVLDIRTAEQQAGDPRRRDAARESAEAYLDRLLAGPTATDDLWDVVEQEDELDPFQRLAAAELLVGRLHELDVRAGKEFSSITKDQMEKETVLAAARAAELPPRVKEKVIALAEEWEYKPPRQSGNQTLAEETKRRRLAESEAKYLIASNVDWEMVSDEDATRAEQRRLYEEVVATRRELLGENHLETVRAMFYLAATLESREGCIAMREKAAMNLEQSGQLPDEELLSDYARHALFLLLATVDTPLVQRWIHRIETTWPALSDKYLSLWCDQLMISPSDCRKGQLMRSESQLLEAAMGKWINGRTSMLAYTVLGEGTLGNFDWMPNAQDALRLIHEQAQQRVAVDPDDQHAINTLNLLAEAEVLIGENVVVP